MHEMDEERGSLEGFLCPVCFTNFKTSAHLSGHYEHHHSEDLFKNVKEILGKAKKKIFKEQANNIPESEQSITKKIIGYCSSPVNSESGPVRSHSEFYKSVRMKKIEHYAAQTNNLLIRLEKLLINLPSDKNKRKVHEQDIVPWLDDKDVRLCPGCGKPFGLLRRKHHCRLCGSVMCSECTCQLSLETARKMTGSPVSTEPQHSDLGAEKVTPVKKILRSPSGAGVQSVLTLDASNESFFRLCEHCNLLLEKRQIIREVRNQRPIIVQYYEKLRTSMNDSKPLLAQYSKVYNSLCSGETIYNLNDAELLRVRIVKLAENIDFLSNKIAILHQNTEKPSGGNELLVQKTVRIAATNYIKEHVITLPTLPSEEQVKLVQDKRREEIARRLEEENKYEEELVPKSRQLTNNINSVSSNRDADKHVEAGWVPAVPQGKLQDADHPILQQIIMIQNYLKQARSENRMDEVDTLTINLRELGEEFRKQFELKESDS